MPRAALPHGEETKVRGKRTMGGPTGMRQPAMALATTLRPADRPAESPAAPVRPKPKGCMRESRLCSPAGRGETRAGIARTRSGRGSWDHDLTGILAFAIRQRARRERNGSAKQSRIWTHRPEAGGRDGIGPATAVGHDKQSTNGLRYSGRTCHAILRRQTEKRFENVQ